MRWEGGWTSIVLVLLMMVTLAWSIQGAGWVPGLEILTPIVVAGVLCGALLSGLRWMPVSVAHGWSMVIGFLLAFLAGAAILGRYESVDPSWLAESSLYERMRLARDWYMGWIRIAATDSYDGSVLQSEMSLLFAVLTMALLLWLLAYICVWFAARYASWAGAVLPCGFALLFSLYSSKRGDGVIYLAFFLVCALLLAARTHLVLRQEEWRRRRVGHGREVETDFLRDGLLVALAVIGLGLLLPGSLRAEGLGALSGSLSSMQQGAQDLSSRYLPSIEYPYPTRGGGNSFGSSMPLAGAISLGTGPVFDARVAAEGPQPRYFRMAVYDRYDGAGWQRTTEDRGEGMPGEMDLAPDYALSVPVTQTIQTTRADTQQLFAAPQPERFDIPVRYERAAGEADLLAVESIDPLPVGASYEVVSRLSQADETSLAAADGQSDPAWVRERYLGLPEGFPERVSALATDVTAESGSRYEAARAIETYLRQNMTYDENIDLPPEGRDKVDWFLFDTQRGYCDYYSSAFVTMARSAGIPARVAAGYAAGEYLPERSLYRQRDSDAHTWPEVYFPGYGWVEFEPTASEAPLLRPAGPEELAGELDDPLAPPNPPEREEILPEDDMFQPDDRGQMLPQDPTADATSPGGFTLPVWPFALLLLLGLAVGAAYQWLWRRPLRGLSPAERGFSRVLLAAGWLGLRPGRGETPSEYGSRVGDLIPTASGDVHAITEAYVGERFGRRGSAEQEAPLEAAWRRTRQALVRGAGALGLEELKKRFRRGR